MTKVKYSVEDQVALIELDNPPLNTLSFELRNSIVGGIDQAINNDSVKAIVLMGNDRAFSSGADISEFETLEAYKEPNLRTLINIVETCPKPVIVAISGACMGGGLELSLGCHFRIAKPDASIAFPEVKLGFVPGAGGTQRLPRLAGVEIALNMIVSGQTVPAMMLMGTNLFDDIVSGDLKDDALAFAKTVIAEGRPIKKARDEDVQMPNSEAYFQFARNIISTQSKGLSAPLKAVEAVAAAVTEPFDKGLEIEQNLFMGLFISAESAALRHLFFAERAASKIPDVPKDIPLRSINKVGVIGAGTMGGGITMNFLNVGIPVTLVDTTQEALDRGLATIQKNYMGSIAKGKLSQGEVDKAMNLLTPSLTLEAVKEADLVIEAVFEQMDLKKEVFTKLDTIAKPGAILATNTSTLNINEIAHVTSRPQDVLGTHFFSPANIMKLLEVVRGADTGKDVLATVMQLGKKIKKVPVVAGVCEGFIGNRMLVRYAAMAYDLLEQGASPLLIDKALESWGMAMGPFRMGDLSGNDVGWLIRKRHYEENPNARKFIIGDQLCEMGRFGQKTGAGWYRYEKGQKDPIPDPIVEKIIQDYRQEAGIHSRIISDQEVVERCIYALVNEGARILEEGIALRSSDIDVIYIYGYGFPAFRGGPMKYADQIGLFTLARRMRQFASEPGENKEFWTPASLIDKLIQENKMFSQLDSGG